MAVIGFYHSHITWPSHFETELELIQKHLNEGDTVYHLVCNASLCICDINLDHNVDRCLSCISKRKTGISMLKGEVKEIELLSLLTEEDYKKINSIPKIFDSIEHLQEFYYEEFPAGYGAGSSVISLFRDPAYDVRANAETIGKYLRSSIAVYIGVKHFIRRYSPQDIYVFNGRFAHNRAVLSACRKEKIRCLIHERGNRPGYYEVFENRTPQDLYYQQERIRNAWEKADPQTREELGASFFTDRARGMPDGWYSYVGHQVAGKMPEGWDPQKKNIVVFNTSEDEFASCSDEWKNKIYPSQYEAIRQIARELSRQPEYALWLRVHPNLLNASPREQKMIDSLQGEPVHVISASSDVNTYALVKEAHIVLTFGSTVGIESAYWGKASVLAGPALYDTLGATYNPGSHEEVLELLRSDLKPLDKTGALMYGYYMKTFGTPFSLFKAEGFDKGTFMGTEILPFVQKDKWAKLHKAYNCGNRFLRSAVYRLIMNKSRKLSQ